MISLEIKKYFHWKKVLEYNRAFMKGFAGSAKSYTINKLKNGIIKRRDDSSFIWN